MQITIAGVAVPVMHGSVSIQKQVGQRSTGGFVVEDDAGMLRFYQGQPVVVTDNNSNRAFTGVVLTDDRQRVTQGPLLEHTVKIADNHYYADKRLAPYAAQNKMAGAIFQDIITQFLAAEGVTWLRGVNLLSAQQSDLEGSATLPSPDFKQGLGASGSLTRDTTQAWHGGASLKAVADGSGTFQSVSVNLATSAFVGGATYTFSAYLRAASGTPTLRFYCQANDLIAGNASIGSVGNVTLSTSWTRYSFTVTLPANLAPYSIIGLRADTGSTAQAVTFWLDGLQIEQAGSATAWEVGNGGVPSIQDGPTVLSLISNYASCSALFDALVQKAGGGWFWNIDANRVAWFQQQLSAPAAPYVIDDTITERDSEVATHAADQYRNTQYMLGGVDVTAQQTETRIGDGHTTAFTMGYPLNSVPTITLNGGAQTVGIANVDTGKQWYWNAGSNVITQDNAGTKLVATDTLQVVYFGQFPSVAISTDNAAIATQQSRENAAGGGVPSSTGIVEGVAFDTTLTSAAQAFQSAAGILAQFAHDLDTYEGMTSTYGFAEGQLATVNVPAHGFNNEQMLIESVTLTDVGPLGSEVVDLYYALKAVSGPISSGWQAYFKSLAGQAAQIIGAVTLGQSSTLALAESVSESWSWTESVAATVYACPIFPMTFPKTFC